MNETKCCVSWICLLAGPDDELVRSKHFAPDKYTILLYINKVLCYRLPCGIHMYSCHVIYVTESVVAYCVCRPKQVFVREKSFSVFMILNVREKYTVINSGTCKRNRRDYLEPGLNRGRRQQVHYRLSDHWLLCLFTIQLNGRITETVLPKLTQPLCHCPTPSLY